MTEPTTSICQACGNSSNTRMVACDKCGSWWDFDCVGVGERISEKNFVCRKCIFVEDDTPKTPVKAPSVHGSTSSTRSMSKLRMMRIEEQMKLMERRLELQQDEQRRRHAAERSMMEVDMEKKRIELEELYLKEKYRALEEDLEDDRDDQRSKKSEQSSISKVTKWREQHLGGLVNSTIKTQETVPTTTSTAVVQDPPVSGVVQSIANSSTVMSVGNSAVSVITSTTASSYRANVQTSQMSIQDSTSTWTIPVYTQPIPAVGGKPNQTNLPVSSGNNNLGGLLNRTSLQYPFGIPQVSGVNKSVTGGTNQVGNYPVQGNSQGTNTNQQVGDSLGPVQGRNQGRSSNPPESYFPPFLSYPYPLDGSCSLPPGLMWAPPPQPVPSNHPVVANLPQPGLPNPPIALSPVVSQGGSNPPQPGLPNPPVIPPPVVNQGGFNPMQSIYCLPPGLVWANQTQANLPYPPIIHPPGVNPVVPTAGQLAARQSMSKDLPTFSGNPEEWPLFISSFNNSTNACGFTQAENLMRLQRCLRGPALEAVRSRLLIPDSVPQVINTLQTLYGRPEILVYALLKKVREVPAPKPEKVETLIGYGMAVQNLSDHLHASNQEAHLNNPTLLYELVEKLPANLKLDWAMVKRQQPGADLRTFAAYMSTIVAAATEVTLAVDTKPSHQKPDKSKEKNFCNPHSADTASHSKVTDTASSSSGKLCLVCQDPSHKVKDCSTFQKLDVDNRWKLVQKLSLCRICLFSHGRRPCKSKGRCDVEGCEYRHHPLLHSTTKKNSPSTPSSTAVQNHHHSGRGSLFRIIPVKLHGPDRSITTFAFLDDGSSITLVEDSLTDYLGVDGKADNLCLTWTANVTRSEEHSKRVKLDISSIAPGKKFTLAEARTVKSLGLPRQSLCYKELAERYPYLAGLPVQDYENAVPKILIGNDNAHLSVALKRCDRQMNEPIATKTRLGWSIHGPTSTQATGQGVSMHICECASEFEDLHELVKQHFSLESMGVSVQRNLESEEDSRARKILERTTRRVGLQFEIGLLWKFDDYEFPDSYFMAVRRLECLERRMKAEPELGAGVAKQIEEFKRKGYLVKATEADLISVDPRRVWYLPLGVVLNPKKPGKIRIFCDAAAKVDGVSLNTLLLKGPDLLVPLQTVLTGFRERRIAVCADVREMFQQKLPGRHSGYC